MGTNTETVNGATKTSTINGPNAGPVIQVAPPATSTSAGAPNQIAMDGNFLYVCIATNSWKRVNLDAF